MISCFYSCTSTYKNVTLEMNSIAFRKFEHRKKLGLGHSPSFVVRKSGDDISLRTAAIKKIKLHKKKKKKKIKLLAILNKKKMLGKLKQMFLKETSW